MTEFNAAFKVISEIQKQFCSISNAHDGKAFSVRKSEINTYEILKLLALETQQPFISKFDQVDYDTRKHWESFWMLSPLLGKKQLREGSSDVLTAITKIENKRPVFSLMLLPKKNQLFIAIDEKAFKIENFKSKSNLTLDELLVEDHLIQKPIEGFFFTIMKNKHNMNTKTEKFLEHFKLYKSGAIKETIDESPLNLIGIAEGVYDFHPRLKTINEWDIAPFDALITASGNRITQKDGIMPLSYNSEKLRFSGFIAKNNFETDSIDLLT